MTPAPLTAHDWRMVVGIGMPSLASGLFMPLTLVYFTVLTDIALPTLGLITSAAVLVTVPLPLATGPLVDRWGASRVVRVALLIQAAGFAGFAVARAPLAVLVVSTIMAIGSRVYWSAIFAAIANHADNAAGRSSEWWFAAANVSRTVGITTGGVITGVVITIGSDAVYVGVAVAAGTLLVAAAMLLPQERTTETYRNGLSTHVTTALRDHAFVRYTLLNAVFALSVLFLGLSLPTAMRSGLHGPGWLTALYLTANALIVALVGLRAGRWVERRPRARALAVSGMVWAGAYAIVAVAVELPLWGAVVPLGLAVVGIATAEAIQAPASMALATQSASLEARGRYLALFQYSWLIAEIAGPLLFAAVFVHEAWLPFALVSAANLGAVAALPRVTRSLQRRTAGAPE